VRRTYFKKNLIYFKLLTCFLPFSFIFFECITITLSSPETLSMDGKDYEKSLADIINASSECFSIRGLMCEKLCP